MMTPTMLLTDLTEAERASDAAEMLSYTIKDVVIEMPTAVNLSTSDVLKISKQKDMLFKELETFSNLRRTLEQLLKSTASSKQQPDTDETSKYIEVLLDMVLEDEAENAKLKNSLNEKEMKIQEVFLLLHKEKDRISTANRLAESLEAIQSHLQSHIQKKEVENEVMKEKIKNLNTAISEKKLERKEAKRKILLVKEKSAHENEALKKAIKVLKKKAQHLEDAKENVTAKIREKDIELHEVASSGNIWKSHHELVVKERTELQVKIESLTQQMNDISASLQKIREDGAKSKEELLKRIQATSLENEHLNKENTRLKVSVDKMEANILSYESECTDLQEKLKQEKNFVEQYEMQFRKIQSETKKLKSRLEKVLEESKHISETKDSGTEKVLSQMDAHIKELEHIPGLLKTADKSLQACEESLLVSKRKYTGQSNTITQLSKKVDANSFFLENHSLETENSRIQKKLAVLNQKLENMVTQNQELKDNVAHQEESLRKSTSQLDEKSQECSALLRLLETAVEDGRKQVSTEKEKTALREQAIAKRLLELETELRKRKEEKKQVACTLSISEKHYELRLRGLKYSLEQTETKNQNIQNYVQLLKTSYAAMFG
ncbi:protein BCAP isoform X2 [Pleurodeles waltl]|uniref:protein BCAP isoform X2 n=1 Tax=Pleurodeles waltl TaxID=8319 RepID=UPI0037095D74